jgi:hypothetical protein
MLVTEATLKERQSWRSVSNTRTVVLSSLSFSEPVPLGALLVGIRSLFKVQFIVRVVPSILVNTTITGTVLDVNLLTISSCV